MTLGANANVPALVSYLIEVRAPAPRIHLARIPVVVGGTRD